MGMRRRKYFNSINSSNLKSSTHSEAKILFMFAFYNEKGKKRPMLYKLLVFQKPIGQRRRDIASKIGLQNEYSKVLNG